MVSPPGPSPMATPLPSTPEEVDEDQQLNEVDHKLAAVGTGGARANAQQTSPPSTTTGLATPSPSPLRYQVPLPLTHKINTANAHRGRRDYFPSAAPSGMPGLPEEHEGESGDEVLGEEEDEYLLKLRKSIGRDKVSASLPNIFQTPTKTSGAGHSSAFPPFLAHKKAQPRTLAIPASQLSTRPDAKAAADVFSADYDRTPPVLVTNINSTGGNEVWSFSPTRSSFQGLSFQNAPTPRIQLTPPTKTTARNPFRASLPLSPPESPENAKRCLSRASQLQQQEVAQEESEWNEIVDSVEMPTSAPGSITRFPTSPSISPTFHLTPPSATAHQHRVGPSHRAHPPPPLRPVSAYPLTPTPTRRSTLLSPDSADPSASPRGFPDEKWFGGSGRQSASPAAGGLRFGEMGGAVEESRFVLVWDLPSGVEVGLLKEVFLGMGDLRAILVKFLPSHGAIILAFHDLRHAISTSKTLQRKTVDRLGPDVKLRSSFVAKRTVEQLVGETKQGMQLVGENDGGVMVTMLDAQEGKLSLLGLQATLGAFGELRSFRVVGTQSRAFLAEFFDSRAASDAKNALHNRKVEETLLHVTFHNAPVPTPVFDSPITPTRRSDHEALYHHLASLAVETASPTKPRPETDALQGAVPATGGPYDHASFGRRGSTTGSFLPSTPSYGSSSPSRARLASRRPPASDDSSPVGQADAEDESAPSSPTVGGYLSAGRRSSNFVGFDKSSLSSKFSFPSSPSTPSSAKRPSGPPRGLTVPIPFSPMHHSYSSAPTTPGPFTARSWLSTSGIETQAGQPQTPGTAFSFQTAQQPSTPATLLSFFAQAQALQNQNINNSNKTQDSSSSSSISGSPTDDTGSSSSDYEFFNPPSPAAIIPAQIHQLHKKSPGGSARKGGGAAQYPLGSTPLPGQWQQSVEANRRRFEFYPPGGAGGGPGQDQAVLPANARGVLSVLRAEEVPEANRVVLDRISQGLETRTTLMIKDVPNKLTRSALIAILDSVVPLGYDFVYLRMDFRNRCNVGYAFVNFSSVEALWVFAATKMNTKWMIFSSEKVLQLSFANVQGKEALVNKFRNSAVMLQEDGYQPVIFYTDGPYRGRRQAFPPPTDPARRENSLRSTQFIGLYHHLQAPMHPVPLTRSLSNPGYSTGVEGGGSPGGGRHQHQQQAFF